MLCRNKRPSGVQSVIYLEPNGVGPYKEIEVMAELIVNAARFR